MELPILFFTFLLVIGQIHTKELAPGPEAIKEATSNSTASPTSAQKNQKRYVTKEVILYLTPSQIRALQAGQGLISPASASESAEQQLHHQQLELHEHHDLLHQQFENIKLAPVEEQQAEELETSTPIPLENEQHKYDFSNPWNQEIKYYYPHLEQNEQIEQVQVQEKEPEVQRNGWVPSVPISEQHQENQALHEQLKQHWNRILDHNRIQLKALSSLSSQQRQNSEPTAKPLPQLQYAPKYNDQKNAIEIEKLIRQRHRHELEKQSAVAQAEAIANSPPILVHEEVKITKHHPVPVVKHVKVHVPTPVLVPVPEPYEVKVPQPYPVPLEVYKPVPVPIIKTHKVEVEKPVPYEVERRIPVPVLKKVFVNVDRPYFVERIVPVEIKKEVPVEIPIHKAEKVTILRHVWKH